MKFYSDKFNCKKCFKVILVSVPSDQTPARGGAVDVDCPHCMTPQRFLSSGVWGITDTKLDDHVLGTYGK